MESAKEGHRADKQHGSRVFLPHVIFVFSQSSTGSGPCGRSRDNSWQAQAHGIPSLGGGLAAGDAARRSDRKRLGSVSLTSFPAPGSLHGG